MQVREGTIEGTKLFDREIVPSFVRTYSDAQIARSGEREAAQQTLRPPGFLAALELYRAMNNWGVSEQ